MSEANEIKTSLFSQAGKFIQTAEGELDLVILPTVQALNARWAAGEYDDTYYLTSNGVEPRPPNPARLVGSDLLDLPCPCTITINGVAYACEDDHAELEFDQAGTYRIVVSKWPYLDAEFGYENPAQ